MESLLFGLIAEGPSDIAVLRNIISGFRNDYSEKYTDFTRLQPQNDRSSAGWTKVLSYCRSMQFRDFLKNSTGFVVIQIDTDCCEHWKDNKGDFSFSSVGLSLVEIIGATKNKFETLFAFALGEEFITKYQDRIIYAISVDAIECWLLPVHSETDKNENTNCHHLLGEPKKEWFKYSELSKPLANQKDLIGFATENQSLQTFIDELQLKNIPVCP